MEAGFFKSCLLNRTEVDFNQKLDIMDEIPMPTYADFLCFINTNYRIHG